MAAVTESRVDALLTKLRDIFEIKSGYKDDVFQAKLLEKHFKTFDSDGSGIIDFDEFSRAMVKLNFVGVQAEVEALFDRFDEDLNGSRGYCNEQLVAAAGSRQDSGRRRENGIRTLGVILRRMDQNGNGVIEIEEFQEGTLQLGLGGIDASELERVFRFFDADQSGKITVHELMRGLRDGTITWHEFLSYYKDLSAGIANDDEFELMIRNAWYLSGGKGWCANTTCRRVLVTFRDGSQRVLEIENDLGVNANDKRKMIQKLTEQGYRQIVDISLAN
ncbi:Calcyphosin, partial [Globisporangium splendens]